MIHLKHFEELDDEFWKEVETPIDPNKPQIGDYVICDSPSEPLNDEFVKCHIGKIIGIKREEIIKPDQIGYFVAHYTKGKRLVYKIKYDIPYYKDLNTIDVFEENIKHFSWRKK